MSTAGTTAGTVNPAWAHATQNLREFGRLMARIAHRLDIAMLAALLWGAGYLVFAVTSGRDLSGHAAVSDFWLIPIDGAIGLLAVILALDNRLARRDRLPWVLIAIAGVTAPLVDTLWIFADSPMRMVPDRFAASLTIVPMLTVGSALVAFRPARVTRARSRTQYLLDHAAVALVTALSLWYFLVEPLPETTTTGLVYRATMVALAIAAVAVMARIALRPTIGVSPRAASLLVLGSMAAILGTLAMGNLGPVTSESALIGQVAMAALRVAFVLACRAEMVARDQVEDTGRERGPSPLFYACMAVGSAPLALLVLDLGLRYIAVVAAALCLSGMVAVRQHLSVKDAVAADRARRKTEARFGWLVRNSSDFIMSVDAQGTIDYVSPSVERLLHAPSNDLLGTSLAELAHPEDVGALISLVDRAMIRPGLRVSGEWRLRQTDGTWLPVETVACSGTGDPDTTGVVLNTRDLQERKALEQKLTFQAFHDPLTRLANRSLFRERVEHALDRRRVTTLSVLFIDLDNFKTINDSLGHAAGDHVLVETAHRVRSTLRTEDTAARLGGDEFAVLMEDADVTAAARVAERIRLALGVPFWVLGQEVYVSASIGIAVRQEGDTANELLRNADVAMYTAKTKGKARFEIFEPAMHDAVVARLGLEAELRRAIEHQEFVVYYQPIVRLESGEVIGAEALVRWQHPTRGLVPPLEFIPLAEETGLIVPLGGWILRQACHQLAEWQKLRGGGEPFVMNVNLSSRQLVREAIAEEVAAAVDESGIRASWLVLEVTETVLMADPVAAASALGHIRDLGVRVALDDFGSGYSSLSHLRRFPIDIVKIDKSFVDDVGGSGVESAIARGIIELGRAMHLETVAEGIEHDGQAEALRSLGCDLGQGFFFARPMDSAAWAEMLHTDAAAGGAAEPTQARPVATSKRRKTNREAA
jgi:diguanylate cyclase (GGDEF)-like protein/PAS domain S-box-containing protein